MTSPQDVTPPSHVFVMGMSRSGTTLLATVLDAHPTISMGYELLPGGLPSPLHCAGLIESAIEVAGDESRAVARELQDGMPNLATFVRRAARTLVQPREMAELFHAYSKDVDHLLESIEGRAQISDMVVRRKQAAEGTSVRGFKLNNPSIEAFDKQFPDARYLYILRDPRDVYVSHVKNSFDRTVDEVTNSWNNYLEKFLRFREGHPGRTALLRYEDLVREPKRTLVQAMERIGLEFHPLMVDYTKSKAGAQASRHGNASSLNQGFFTSSINRWAGVLGQEVTRKIVSQCGDRMEEFGYLIFPSTASVHVPRRRRQKMQETFGAKRKFYRDEYNQLVIPFTQQGTNLTWAEAARGEEVPTDTVVIIRHDIDHDLETALQIAEWENEKGIRATYCPLHTAWYYGELGGGGYQHSDFLIESCLELQRLGHEINLHNNFVSVALQNGIDPIALLEREVVALRSFGIDVRGTSMHGDRLCREVGFYNCELFSEGVYESSGGPRMVEYEGNRVQLGATSMRDLGLEYEAYDLPRDAYVTDSGGRLRYRRNTRGRGGIRRAEMTEPPKYGRICGVLTHPVWWKFDEDGGRRLADVVEEPEKWPFG